MKRTPFILVICIFILLSGCVRQSPALVGTPTPQFTPTPPPTPTPELILLPSDTDVDALGKRIDTDSHFLNYLAFQNIRIYEYDGDTFLDGICINTYSEPLTGMFEIVFTQDSGAELARAPIVTRNADDTFQPGETEIFAQIDTDMDIQLQSFEIYVKQRVWPAVTVTPTE